MLNKSLFNGKIKLPQSRYRTTDFILCFGRMFRYFPETAKQNLAFICDTDFIISY